MRKLSKNTKGSVQELIEVAIGIMIIGVVMYAWVFAGSELEDSADIEENSSWANISAGVGSMSEKGVSMLAIGVMLLAIFAAVGFLVYPYLNRAMGRP